MAREHFDRALPVLPATEKTFILRSAVACAAAPQAPPLSPDLQVVKKAKAPVMTTLEEFYKVEPAPSKHPNTMTCKRMAGDTVLHELECYSVGGGFIEWKGYEPPKKGQPKELLAHAQRDFDTTVGGMALTAREMHSKYQETSEGGLAVSVVLC
jgi:hypothetical protein